MKQIKSRISRTEIAILLYKAIENWTEYGRKYNLLTKKADSHSYKKHK